MDGLVQGKEEKIRFPTGWIIIHSAGFYVLVPRRCIRRLLNRGPPDTGENWRVCVVAVYPADRFPASPPRKYTCGGTNEAKTDVTGVGMVVEAEGKRLAIEVRSDGNLGRTSPVDM